MLKPLSYKAQHNEEDLPANVLCYWYYGNK